MKVQSAPMNNTFTASKTPSVNDAEPTQTASSILDDKIVPIPSISTDIDIPATQDEDYLFQKDSVLNSQEPRITSTSPSIPQFFIRFPKFFLSI
eukprot:Ihof_evm1s745 gene=Ihof_evmTU1s745